MNYSVAANLVTQKWSKYIKNLVPDNVVLETTIPFKKMDVQLSGKYNVPIISNWPQGFTLGAAGTDQNLLSSISPTFPLAQVDAPWITNRLTITYEMLKRMGNDTWYTDLVSKNFENTKKSHVSLLEALDLYGSDANGFGTVSVIAGDVVTITTSEWGAGLFLNRGNAIFDVYTAGVFTGKQVSLVGVNRQTLRSIQLAVGDGAKLAVGDQLRIRSGVAASSEYLGIKSILSATTTLFGVSIAANPLYQGTRVTIAGALTFVALYASLIKVSNFNFDGDCMFVVNPLAFGDIVNQVEGARTFGGDQYNSRVMKRGLQMLEIIGPKGKLDIYGHPMMKEGDAMGLKLDTWEKPGVCEVELLQSGGVNGYGPLWAVPGSNAMELKTYSQNSLYCSDPASNILMGGVVNSAAIAIGAV